MRWSNTGASTQQLVRSAYKASALVTSGSMGIGLVRSADDGESRAPRTRLSWSPKREALLDELDSQRVRVLDRARPHRPRGDEPHEPAGDAAAAAVAGDGHELFSVRVRMRLA